MANFVSGAPFHQSTFPTITLSLSFKRAKQHNRLNPSIVTQEVHRLAIEHMKLIVAKTEKNLASHTSNPSLLNEGVYYGTDYCDALKYHGEKTKKRLDYLMKREAFYTGYAPSKLFSRLKALPNSRDITEYQFMKFIKKKEIPASVALEGAIQGPTIVGCGEVCQLAYYCALKTLFGDDLFNRVFDTNFEIRFDNDKGPLMQFCSISKWSTKSQKELCPGAITYFVTNPKITPYDLMKSDDYPKDTLIDIFSLRQPAGEWGAYNTIYLGNDLYIGAGVSSAGICEEHVVNHLFKEFKRDEAHIHKPHNYYSKKIADIRCLRRLPHEVYLEMESFVSALSFEQYQELEGGQKHFFVVFDGNKILPHLVA